MSARFVDQKTIPLLSAIVLVLGVVEVLSFLSPPGSVRKSGPLLSQGRQLASVDASAALAETQTSRFSRPVVFPLDLNSTAQDLDADGTHLRLKGQLKGRRPQAIRNVTNGFTAAIFDRGTSYTTDFIELKEGDNEIEIQVLDQKGQKITRKMHVQRRVPASQ